MDSKLRTLSGLLEELDANPHLDFPDLAVLSSDGGLVEYLAGNMNESSVHLLRQLLEHTPQTVLENVITNKSLLAQLITYTTSSEVTYDLAKVLCEVYDESYANLITPQVLEKLVNSLESSSDAACQRIIILLAIISDKYISDILILPNSRYFGEILLLRFNRTEGAERKLILNTINRILYQFPQFFYTNDLKTLADIAVGVLEEGGKDIVKPALEILKGIFTIQDFLALKYRLEELFELLETIQMDKDLKRLKESILGTLKLNNI
jgi:Protein of unknown function (DUF2013)